MSENLIKRDGIWYFRVQIANRDIRRSLHTTRKRVARKRAVLVADEIFGDDLSTYPPKRLIQALLDRPSIKRDGIVYFMQGEKGGPIKIGRSQNAKQRLDKLQIGSNIRLRLVRWLPFVPGVEASLHKRFAAERLHGEWFRPSGRLKRFMAAIPPAQLSAHPQRSEAPGHG